MTLQEAVDSVPADQDARIVYEVLPGGRERVVSVEMYLPFSLSTTRDALNASVRRKSVTD
jgi:hypothetical protein